MTLRESLFYDLPDGKKTIFHLILFHFIDPKFRILKNYRLAKYFGSSKFKLFRFFSIRLTFNMIRKGNCDFHIHSTIGKKLKLAHPLGIVIGAGVIIEDNVTIFQNVTLGSHGRDNENEKGYPLIGNNVIIYSGATLIGQISVGDNAIIGANSLINKDVPSGYIAYGNPMTLKKRNLTL